MSPVFEVGLDKQVGYMWVVLKKPNNIIDLNNPVLALINELLINPYLIVLKKHEDLLINLTDEGYICVLSDANYNYYEAHKSFTQYDLLSGDQIRFIVYSGHSERLYREGIFNSERIYVDNSDNIKYVISPDFDAEGIEVYFKPEADNLNLLLEKINLFSHNTKEIS